MNIENLSDEALVAGTCAPISMDKYATPETIQIIRDAFEKEPIFEENAREVCHALIDGIRNKLPDDEIKTAMMAANKFTDIENGILITIRAWDIFKEYQDESKELRAALTRTITPMSGISN